MGNRSIPNTESFEQCKRRLWVTIAGGLQPGSSYIVHCPGEAPVSIMIGTTRQSIRATIVPKQEPIVSVY